MIQYLPKEAEDHMKTRQEIIQKDDVIFIWKKELKTRDKCLDVFKEEPSTNLLMLKERKQK